ncbi:hypothetical protein PT2222_10068 [Paraburkholderia tropica]
MRKDVRRRVFRGLASGGLADFLQQIAETAHRDDFDTAVFELLAHAVHVDFDRGIAEIAAEVREVILQLRLAHDAAMTQQQHFEHGEFARREFERLVVVEDAAVDAREAHAAERHFRTRHVAVRAAATHHGANARFEFGGLERLEHVVVGARIEALHAVVQLVARGEDDHRRVTIALTEAREQRHAVDAGQAQIEDHELMAILRECLFGEDAVVDHVDREAGLFEAGLDAACDGAVVFDQKESHGFRSSTMGLAFRHAVRKAPLGSKAQRLSGTACDDCTVTTPCPIFRLPNSKPQSTSGATVRLRAATNSRCARRQARSPGRMRC